MRTETLDWLKEIPLEALQCRDLRHAWPRAQTRRGRNLESKDGITWQPLITAADGTPRELQREMLCIGGCGVVRVEEFIVDREGNMRRAGKPRYRHPKTYLRQRGKDEPLLDPIDTDTLRGILVHRLYPRLAW